MAVLPAVGRSILLWSTHPDSSLDLASIIDGQWCHESENKSLKLPSEFTLQLLYQVLSDKTYTLNNYVTLAKNSSNCSNKMAQC